MSTVDELVRKYAAEHSLSPQETRVLAAAVSGTANKVAAGELSCNRSTISTYWKRIFSKTGCRSQREVLGHLIRTMSGPSDGAFSETA